MPLIFWCLLAYYTEVILLRLHTLTSRRFLDKIGASVERTSLCWRKHIFFSLGSHGKPRGVVYSVELIFSIKRSAFCIIRDTSINQTTKHNIVLVLETEKLGDKLATNSTDKVILTRISPRNDDIIVKEI